MAIIDVQAELAVSPDTLWKEVTDVGNVSSFLDVVAESSMKSDDVRKCILAEEVGSIELEETIIKNSAEDKTVEYRITPGPMGITSHHASMQVTPAGDGRSVIRWVTNVTPDELAGAMRPMFEAEMAALKERFGA